MDVNKYFEDYPHLNDKEQKILDVTLSNEPLLKAFEFRLKVAIHCAYQTGYTDCQKDRDKITDKMLEEMHKQEVTR